MREVKFRAWNRIEELMLTVTGIMRDDGFVTHLEDIEIVEEVMEDGSARTIPVSCSQLKDVVLLEYTGLKDKNGKEIYEGDIVKLIHNCRSNNCEIKRHESGGWLAQSIDSVNKGSGMLTTSQEFHNTSYIQVEVIGNIYENPDLLPSYSDE